MSKAKFIGVFGRRNSGKSSLINTLSGEQVAIVSETPGTTTDPVKKRMEIFGIGPCVFIDTAGIDDEGDLGEQRVAKTRQVILQIDLAILLYTNNEIGSFELELLERFKENNIPVILVHNQSDIISMNKELALEISSKHGFDVLEFSSGMLDEHEQKDVVEQLTSLIVKGLSQSPFAEKGLFEGLVEKDDVVVLVVPIDSEAPEGRIILPQVNAIRDILDRGGVSVVLQPAALENYFKGNNKKIKLIVTDSQAFETVSNSVPANIPLTGFSVLLARSKADFENYLKGTPKIDDLKDGDRILVLESCSHHSSCDDIGRVKIPRLIMNRTGKKIDFDVVAGLDNIPSHIKDYSLVVQCGGCMITQRQLMMRLNPAVKNSIPVTNYGMTIAWCVGIYERAIAPFLKQTE